MTDTDRFALVEKYTHLPRVTAARFAKGLPPSLDMGDLVGAGNLGLCKAAATYDPAHGACFQTWAIALIRGAILEMLREWDFLPRSVREAVRRAQIHVDPPDSLDRPVRRQGGDIPGRTLGEFILDTRPGPEELTAGAAQSQEMARIVEGLPEREGEVIRRYYSRRQTFKEIGTDLGISESRSYQLHQQAIQRLRIDGRIQALLQ